MANSKIAKKLFRESAILIAELLVNMATGGHWKILADKWQSQGLNGINGDSPKLRKRN